MNNIRTSKKIFKISQNSKYGRFLVANESIEAGELVIDEPAILQCPYAESLICLTCQKHIQNSESCKSCPRCSLQYFDSFECFEHETHKLKECPVLRRLNQKIPLASLKPIDICQLVTAIRSIYLKFQDELKWKQILNLDANSKFKLNFATEYKNSKLGQALQNLSWHLFENVEKNEEMVSKVKLEQEDSILSSAIHSIGVFENNSFTNKEVSNLYFFSSLMSHSCIPNTDRQFDVTSSRMVVKSARKIESGEQITTTYQPYYLNNLERRREIKNCWNFFCDCERCEDPTEFQTFIGALSCSNCHKFTLCFINDAIWKCEQCTSVYSPKKIVHLLKEVKKIENEFKECSENKLKLQDFLNNSAHKLTALSPNYSFFTISKLMLVQWYGLNEGVDKLSAQELVWKALYCQDLVQTFSKLFKNGIFMTLGTVLGHLWLSLKEINFRLSSNTEKAPSSCDLELLNSVIFNPEDIQIIAFKSYKILKHSLPGTFNYYIMSMIKTDYNLL